MSRKIKQYQPVSFTKVKIMDPFWSPILQVNREKTLAYQYQQCKDTGRVDAFDLKWQPGQEPKPHFFWDSDVAKWVEAASYSLATHPDPPLKALLDEVVERIASAQQPDGYLNVYFTVVEPEKRWTNLRDAHELYCAGHLIEAGVAHFQATGERKLLEVVCRYADYIDNVFGPEPGQKRGYCGHQEIELALVKLYRVTDNTRYLQLSQFFIDERGQEPHYFQIEAEQRGGPGYFEEFMQSHQNMNEYNQSHLPVREQDQVVGHAVRAMYMYSAMADLAGELGDESLLQACQKIWDHVVHKNMYITGGIGSTKSNEGFTFDYDLPNESAYAETCAQVGLVFWNHRLLQLDCDRRYADVLERALYNGVISGISQDGRKFFYANPLASMGDAHRQDWFGCACCPPNIARLLASLGEYIYSSNKDEAVIHLYIAGEGQLTLQDQPITLKQTTQYPWDEKVTIDVGLEKESHFAIKLRIPSWCPQATLQVNHEQIPISALQENGYVRIEREWKNGDQIILQLSMPIERIYAHPMVRQNMGQVALQRGPLVYCLEEVDHGVPLQTIVLPKEAQLQAYFEPSLLGGVTVIKGEALAAELKDWEEELYRPIPPNYQPLLLKAIPYYAWDNREPGQMRVWLAQH